MNLENLPSAFRERMQAQLGNEYPAFEDALSEAPPVSIRLNPRKSAVDTVGLEPVLWCADTASPARGFYLPERPVFTLDPLFQSGAYYVQEASSMLLAEALRQINAGKHPVRALDLCAAPGGKSTLLASVLHPNSLLICNEVIRTRVPILRENIEKWGYPNVVLSNHDPDDFAALTGFFDLLLVDAPCSGEGLFRKDAEAMQEWSEENVQLCSARQKRILSAVTPLLSDGGTLIYSTCTYNDDENSNTVKWLLEQGFEPIRLNIPKEWGIVEKYVDNSVGYQCYPHRVKGEGFFISLFRKTKPTYFSERNHPRNFKNLKALRPRETAQLQTYLANPADFSYWRKPNLEVIAIPVALEKDLLWVDAALRNKGIGFDMGTFKGTDFIPAHALALSTAIADSLPGVELSKEDALRYFKKENLVLDESVRGWLLARYQGQNLGWMKGVGNRVNNYLPKDWRIRMDIKEYT